MQLLKLKWEKWVNTQKNFSGKKYYVTLRNHFLDLGLNEPKIYSGSFRL